MSRHSDSPERLIEPVRHIEVREYLEELGVADASHLAIVSKYSHLIVMGEESSPKIVNFCSEDYNLVRNSDLINNFKASFAEAGFDIEARYMVSHDARFYMDFIAKGFEHQVLKKDTILPMVRVQNSYDGRIKLGAKFGLYRVICSNGAMAPVRDTFSEIVGRHTDSVRLLAEEIVERASDLIGNFDEVIAPMRKLNERKVRDIEKMVEEVAEAVKFPKRQVEEVLDTIQEEMEQYSLPPTQWIVYNGFNNVLNHNDSMKLPEHKREEFDTLILRTLMAS